MVNVTYQFLVGDFQGRLLLVQLVKSVLICGQGLQAQQMLLFKNLGYLIL